MDSLLLPAMGLLAGCAASAHASLTSLAAPLRQARVHVVPFRQALELTTPRVNAASALAATSPASLAREKIKHVIVIMQENRSFDSYFGTYPGADGIPTQNGVLTACVPDPKTKACARPYHDPQDINAGGPHAAAAAAADINGGKMDGFIASFRQGAQACTSPFTPGCVPGAKPDVMGIWNPLPAFDTVKQDGQLGNDFDFSQPPRRPLILSTNPKPGQT